MLNLKPWEYDELTPGELTAMIDGYHRRERISLEKEAWSLMHLMNIHIDKENRIMSITELIGEDNDKKQAEKKDPQQRKSEYQKMKERFDVK